MEYSHLKNKDVHALLDGIEVEDILEIHDIREPSYCLRNLMMAVMLLLELPQDWATVKRITYMASTFIDKLKEVDYKYIT